MRYVNLGGCGLKVSQIGLGMMSYGDPASQQWALNTGSAEPIVRQAVEAGVTFFDTADMYSDGASEEITGRLLGRLFPRRDDFVLATKVYYPTGPGANDRGLSRKHILASIGASLKRLGTDHVDLYQIHRWDEGTPIEETMSALHDVVRAGQARYIGASAMFAWQFAKAQYTAQIGGWTRFRVNAESLQPGQPGGRARDDPVLPRPGNRNRPLQPLGARPARRNPPAHR
jgi:aryl-alcohol dehydrogenase-like predicted oxidoreductase